MTEATAAAAAAAADRNTNANTIMQWCAPYDLEKKTKNKVQHLYLLFRQNKKKRKKERGTDV